MSFHIVTLSEKRRQDLIGQGVTLIEPARISALCRFVVQWLMIAVLVAGGWAIISSSNVVEDARLVQGGVIVIVVVGLGYLLVAWSRNAQKRMLIAYDQWRSQVLAELTNEANAAFQQVGCLSENDFRTIHRSTNYNIFEGCNLAQFGSLRVGYVNVQRKYKETYTTERNGKMETETKTIIEDIWNGTIIIVSAPLPVASDGTVEIRNDGWSKKMAQIRVSAPYLAANYQVGASSDFVAHRTLTPVLQTSIWDYCVKLGDARKPVFVYKDMLLYIGIPNLLLDFGRNLSIGPVPQPHPKPSTLPIIAVFEEIRRFFDKIAGLWNMSIFSPVTRHKLNQTLESIKDTVQFLLEVEKLLPL